MLIIKSQAQAAHFEQGLFVSLKQAIYDNFVQLLELIRRNLKEKYAHSLFLAQIMDPILITTIDFFLKFKPAALWSQQSHI